jgi:YHS domain-containing protein
MRPAQSAALVFFSLVCPVVFLACGVNEDNVEDSARVRSIGEEHLPETRLEVAVRSDETEAAEQGTDVSLPFKPPISMDPVDGSKVSIRRNTPSTEHGGRIYHFSSEENLRLFLEDPEKYVSGSLATY